MKHLYALVTFFAASVLALTPARTEVEKFMVTSQGQMRPEFRWTFEPPAGWIKDERASAQNGMPIYVPTGTDFKSAPALIYVKVTYNSDDRSMDQFVQVAQGRWRAAVPDTSIRRLPDEARSGRGSPWQIFQFLNPSRPQQAHEVMAYGTDTDRDGNTFFVMVALTSPNADAITATVAPYRQALQSH